MIVETLRNIKDYEGKDVEEPRLEDDGTVTQVPITLRTLIWHALNTQGPQNEAIWNPAEKERIYRLTQQLYKAEDGRVDFGPEDRTFIMNRSEKINAPLHHGRLIDALRDPIDEGLEASASAPNDDATGDSGGGE